MQRCISRRAAGGGRGQGPRGGPLLSPGSWPSTQPNRSLNLGALQSRALGAGKGSATGRALAGEGGYACPGKPPPFFPRCSSEVKGAAFPRKPAGAKRRGAFLWVAGKVLGQDFRLGHVSGGQKVGRGGLGGITSRSGCGEAGARPPLSAPLRVVQSDVGGAFRDGKGTPSWPNIFLPVACSPIVRARRLLRSDLFGMVGPSLAVCGPFRSVRSERAPWNPGRGVTMMDEAQTARHRPASGSAPKGTDVGRGGEVEREEN